jgi:hypothetical protein
MEPLPHQLQLDRALAALEVAIARRGGQRRARSHLAIQARRLRRRG